MIFLIFAGEIVSSGVSQSIGVESFD